jgi:hypothetical protein
MLNFNYSLDQELKAPVGSLPSGIQAQAFGMAITRMSRKFHNAVRLLQQPVPGLKTGPISGLAPEWRSRLEAQMRFMGQAPDQLLRVAEQVVHRGAGNAVDQGRKALNWDRWSQLALRTYNEALDAFQQQVNKAMGNSVPTGTPPAMIKLAALAKMKAPALTPRAKNGMAAFDPAYFAGLGATAPPGGDPSAFGPIVLFRILAKADRSKPGGWDLRVDRKVTVSTLARGMKKARSWQKRWSQGKAITHKGWVKEGYDDVMAYMVRGGCIVAYFGDRVGEENSVTELLQASRDMNLPLSGLEQDKTPLVFGALAGASLVGLAAWYLSRGAAPMGEYY